MWTCSKMYSCKSTLMYYYTGEIYEAINQAPTLDETVQESRSTTTPDPGTGELPGKQRED